MQKGSISLLILIGVLLIGAVAGGYFLGLRNGSQVPLPTPIPIPTVQVTISAINPTASGKIYTNDKFKLSFQYPSFYTISEFEGSGIFLTRSSGEKNILEDCFAKKQPECNNYSLRISFDSPERNPNVNLSDFVSLYTHTSSSDYKQIILSGYSALQKQIEGIGTVNNIFVDKGQTILHIQANSTINPEENITNFDQILSTFKFTDQTNSPTPTCMPRPKCLDSTPRCLIPEPINGWCKN